MFGFLFLGLLKGLVRRLFEVVRGLSKAVVVSGGVKWVGKQQSVATRATNCAVEVRRSLSVARWPGCAGRNGKWVEVAAVEGLVIRVSVWRRKG